MDARAAREGGSMNGHRPRQAGKTPLGRTCFPDKPYTNLEALDIREFAQLDPRGFLAQYPYGAVLDEVQHVPALLSYLQVQVDEDPTPGPFILPRQAPRSTRTSCVSAVSSSKAKPRNTPMRRSCARSTARVPTAARRTRHLQHALRDGAWKSGPLRYAAAISSKLTLTRSNGNTYFPVSVRSMIPAVTKALASL